MIVIKAKREIVDDSINKRTSKVEVEKLLIIYSFQVFNLHEIYDNFSTFFQSAISENTLRIDYYAKNIIKLFK